MYKILCLGGGGLRGIFQAEVLANLQAEYGNFWESFDLIIGTSTGSLVAACLKQQIEPQKISEHYRRIGPIAFPQKLSWNLDQSKNVLLAAVNRKTSGAVYKHTYDRIRKLFNRLFGAETTFRDYANGPELAVTSTDMVQGKIRVFSPITWQHDLDHRIVDVLLASSAAPGLLPCCKINDFVLDDQGSVNREERYFVDGGLWANSPILPAIVLAHTNRGIPFNQMKILSIGTGYRYSGIDISEYESSRMEHTEFRLKLLNMAVSASSDAGDRAASYLVGAENYLHVEPALDIAQRADMFDLDFAYKILPQLAVEVADQAGVREFLDTCVVGTQACNDESENDSNAKVVDAFLKS